ncbi:esterase [Variibacter gotjawalensis]|uniref:Esterase n=1 Tax=Variibacter gotjawalensis TaxID=1333996 RepID=A0A0S3Q0A8_9BRAD|nr:prolyl oligopeptidase family serine peptidase [Variibacter gotjawalensis]NIK47406.1 dipeptidyl aminopeptidase/acylaminoacyl peptidase [Variibacter gotjawalensis]RZS49302.1 dipeptidyl aminopeptidase/acylaminoacyl peptidase [Variibacter gotjawalensis]BAT61566.1 esterase [Variibacter gotjawalensis]
MIKAPYGSWNSPITSDLIVAGSIGLNEIRLDGDAVYWVEGRPQEQGRNVIVRVDGDARIDVTQKPFSARTRVHEYGGGAWTVDNGVIYFSNFSDGVLYRQKGNAKPEALTPAPAEKGKGWRFADGIIDRKRNLWIGVGEDHTAGNAHPENYIVAVDLANAPSAPRIIARGHDFYASPKLSPDGEHLVYLWWDHPNMPWNGTTLESVALDASGAPQGEPRTIAGGVAESIFQPEWLPDGSGVLFVSDKSGWWNFYTYDLATAKTRAICPKDTEFGLPQWVFGLSTYAFVDAQRIVCTYSEGGLGKLATLDLAGGTLAPIALPYSAFGSIRANQNTVVFRAGASDKPVSFVRLELASGEHTVLAKATELADRPQIAACLSMAEPIEYPTENGLAAFALFYPPKNAEYEAPAGEQPPLVVMVHGGPTSAAQSALSLGIQYWTSRGIAVLDVNYGGSTGFGRAYRDRLHLSWGVVDVDDCVNGAKYLAAQGRVDGGRCVITGGSAGGYTTLAALAFRDFFQGGGSHYGVSDAAALAADTHKFESRYMDWLIGPYPQEAALYRERSPIHHVDKLDKPVIFFQGDEDMVVPPNQTEMMVDALRAKGNAVGYFLFAGEQHGFRKAGNIQRALDAELYFYAFEVFRTGLKY